MDKELKITKDNFKVMYLLLKKLCKQKGIPKEAETELMIRYYNENSYKIPNILEKENVEIEEDAVNDFLKVLESHIYEWLEEFTSEYNKNRLSFHLSVQIIKFKNYFLRKYQSMK